jgi:excisionase family DNA binding protein
MAHIDKVITLHERIAALDRALKVPELARMLSLSRQQVYQLIQSGQIPAYRIGGALRVDPATVAEWLRKHAA